ncbi:HAD domain-containing protein [Paraburkholderia sp. RL17-380-BIE-A]|uniref:HAD domain-containing protein n=1 Tax=Paraburkholderia sp. RL17-380-BIE-A TaxID=3031630 RepID=UPI0038B813E4
MPNRGHGLLDEFGDITLDACRPLHQYAPYLVGVLTPYPKVQIVLTTSWLHSLGAGETVALLPDQLRLSVVGTTLGTALRFREIRAGKANTMTVFCHAARYGLTRWLVVDNEAWGVFSGVEQHFLHSGPETGLGALEARKQLTEWLAANATGTHLPADACNESRRHLSAPAAARHSSRMRSGRITARSGFPRQAVNG